MSTDTRLADLLKIVVPGPRGKTYATSWTGRRFGVAWDVAQKLVATASKAAVDIADVNDSPYSPHSRPERLDAAAAPVVRELAAAVPRLRQVREEVVAKKPSVRAAPNYDSSRPWEWAFDIETAKWFAALPPGERAGKLHALRNDNAYDPKMRYAILRTPSHLSGISDADRRQIELCGLSIMQGFREISDEMESVNSADRLLRQVGDMLHQEARIHAGVLRQFNESLYDYMSSDDFARLAWFRGEPDAAPMPMPEPATADEEA